MISCHEHQEGAAVLPLANEPGEFYFPPIPNQATHLKSFIDFVRAATGQPISGQTDLHEWSVRNFRLFWHYFLQWSALEWNGSPDLVCQGEAIEEAVFFPDVVLNYADNLLSLRFEAEKIAVTANRAGRQTINLTRAELRDKVERAAASLQRLGLGPGDRVAAVTRNSVEALIVALATAALGATYSSAAPEMGAEGLIDRFGQIEPCILFANAMPEPFDTGMPIEARILAVAAALPSLKAIVLLDDPLEVPKSGVPLHRFQDLLNGERLPQQDWSKFPFNHPLFIMFTSGTTGRPKCIVHGAGGVLLEQVKEHRLHCDLNAGDSLFFHTSCAWMMWNWQIAALASGSRVILYNGPVEHAQTLWRIVADEAVTQFGTSPPYLRLCEEAGLVPASAFDLESLRNILSTGSILHDAQYRWVWSQAKAVPLQSISGGTDILGCFVLGSPALLVHAGESQCRSLGMDVRAQGASGNEEVGELVCANPFPSRPLGFLNDPDGARFHAAYFVQNLGLWTQGDLVSFSATGGARLHGRSDNILNIRGIRVGPAEIYHLLSDWPEIRDVMAVEQRSPTEFSEGRLVLLLVLRDGVALNSQLIVRIRRKLLEAASAAHVPEVILQVASLPLTHSGKRSEAAMADAVNGRPIRNIGALINPESLDEVRGHPALISPPSTTAAVTATDLSSLEDTLRQLFEGIFNMSPIAPDDNFFDLGGSSLMAVRLFTKIRRLTGRELPFSLLLRAPTYPRLAAILQGEAYPRNEQIVLMRPGEQGRPFFMIHSMAGTMLELWPLQRALRTKRAIYGIQARGLEPEGEPQSSVPEMARDYITLMRSVQPAGPYSIGGYSFGGLVAFEMARQLLAAGETVTPVILIDSMLHARFLSGRQWLRYSMARPLKNLRVMLHAPKGRRLAYVGQKAAVLLDYWRVWSGKSPMRLDFVGEHLAEAHLPLELRRVRGGIVLATRLYNPGTFAGSIILIQPEQPAAFDSGPAWQKASGGRIELRVVPGEHLSMITEPYVQALAQEVDRYLNRSNHWALPGCGSG